MRDAAHYHQKAKESAYQKISEETEIFKWFDERHEECPTLPYMFFSYAKDGEKTDPIWIYSDQLNTLGFFVIMDDECKGILVFYELCQEAITMLIDKR
jgi:hypothetical protein